MPTIVWILMWAALGATIAVLVFRERRAGGKGISGHPGESRDQAELRMRQSTQGDQFKQDPGGGF